MEVIVKYPTSVYFKSDMRKWEENEEKEYPEMIEIPESITQWNGISLSCLEKIRYEPMQTLEEHHLKLDSASQSAIILNNGEVLSCSWSVKELEENLIKWGVIKLY